MLVTIINNEFVSCLEVSADLELENFIALCLIEMPHLASIPYSNLCLKFNGISFIPDNSNTKKNLQEFGLKDGDAIILESQSPPINAVAASLAQPLQLPVGSNVVPSTDISLFVSNLVKGIKVPGSSNSKKEQKDKDMSLKIFNSLKEPSRVDALRAFSARLADIYEANPSNYESFHQAFLQHRSDEERRIRLMHDESSEEGQRYIAEMIAKENIDFSHQFAMEHMPEVFIPVHMLYIRMKINGHSVIAFVDSGAQVSILSESCTKRCNISRLIDERFRGTAMGVGGSQKFLGRIHSCQVQVEGHIFSCPFDVMSDRNMDILFGLNMLRRHQCTIDLQKNVLRFGDGTETPFLSEEEYRKETEYIEDTEPVIRSNKTN